MAQILRTESTPHKNTHTTPFKMSPTPFDDNKTWNECYNAYRKVRNPFYDCVMPAHITPKRLEVVGMMYRRVLFTMTYEEIADDMGLETSHRIIGNRLKNMYPSLYVDGNKRYVVKRKHSTETVMHIHSMRERNMSFAAIGKELGMAPQCVWVLYNKCFRNATVVADVGDMAAGGGGA